jgi:hypothetical protein
VSRSVEHARLTSSPGSLRYVPPGTGAPLRAAFFFLSHTRSDRSHTSREICTKCERSSDSSTCYARKTQSEQRRRWQWLLSGLLRCVLGAEARAESSLFFCRGAFLHQLTRNLIATRDQAAPSDSCEVSAVFFA